MFENPSDEDRRALLRRVKTIAVVGLSPNPARPSHGVARAMQRFGYSIIPIHPAATEVLGAKAYRRLSEVHDPIDLVDVFRRAEWIGPIVDDCLALGIKAIWIQEGIVNEAAAERARDNGMTVVMDRCIFRDHLQLCS
ncbi:MAG: CoA-binding protein [Betaproteobacteria bacterium]|nr:CoA-binding protein [Betaproteobacteria bacterium]MDH3435637.1 CoA-binding protein [Betaproteobacteria bacterium]